LLRLSPGLREGKIDEAIKVAERNKKSHLASRHRRLQEFKAHGDSADIPASRSKLPSVLWSVPKPSCTRS